MNKELQASIVNRLRCAEGHTRGVARMVQSEADCLSVVRQIKAVQGALEKVDQLILKEHLTTCVPESLRSEDSAVQERAMLELAGLLTLSGAD